jgi:hypothetical protein
MGNRLANGFYAFEDTDYLLTNNDKVPLRGLPVLRGRETYILGSRVEVGFRVSESRGTQQEQAVRPLSDQSQK